MNKVSIITVNYNGKHLLKACLESLYAQTFRNFEIIVVDNNSSDGSPQYISDSFPHVQLIPLAKNIGFAGANVEGLKHASGTYIFLVNNDTELGKDCIRSLVSAMKSDPGIGIAATKMILHGTGTIDSAGDGYASVGRGFKRGEGSHSSSFNNPEYIFGACAGAALYRRNMLEEIGFFDEDFFLIHEDTDLNFRAQLAGWKAMYVPDAVVYHKVRSTIGHMSDTAIYYTLRNNEFVRIKNIPFGLFIRCLPEFILGTISEFIYFAIRHRKLKSYVKAKIDVLKSLQKTLRKREAIMKKIKKVDNRYLYSIMTPLWSKEFLTMKMKKLLFK